MNEFLTGNQAIVRGALRAGCNFFAGYPITPASSICSDMIQALSERGAQGVQTEDEIAAIGQCIGAAMAGAKAMTASSGPGLSLYSENIGLAQMGEVPLVIVDCQRMGPATGGATTTGDGDIVFARHVTAGGFPLPVLAATDAASAFRLTYEAFNIAERLRTPVIVLASKDISLTRQTVDFNAVELSPLVARQSAAADAPFVPYAIEEPVDVPAFAPIGGRQRVRFTGSIHDETGVLTIDRAKIARKLTHLREKILLVRDSNLPPGESLEYVDVDLDAEAETLIVSYGAADGAVREAVAALRAAGTRVSHLTIYSLWPVPQRVLRRAVTPRIRRVIVPELNIGLYGDVLRGFVGEAAIEPILCFDGRLIPPQRIVEHVREPSLDRTTA